ncbi:MAG TPA: tetratricopeptide repeat protein [Ktedonobacteraceae bacterium]|nr:tetratricopeptide repeat protein [Ktedonobacteraceae bacterium]
MELTLAHQTETQIAVVCDGTPSHTFDLQPLLTYKSRDQLDPFQPLAEPVAYGKLVYQALFPPQTAAWNALQRKPPRLLLVMVDEDLDAIPWEYAYGAEGFLVLEHHVVRGIPEGQRVQFSEADAAGLHIIAVPSHPLDAALAPLNIEGEWTRLKEVIENVPFAVTLERASPPTIEQVHALLVNQRHGILHFMGHGGQHESGAVLFFEKDNGTLDPVPARYMVARIHGSVVLITLNACVSATPGPTAFSNLAAALVRQQIPYVLGMRFSIPDTDARAFSRTFYQDLARGASIEEATLQARLTLSRSVHTGAVGIPVLYTSLAQEVTVVRVQSGSPVIKEHLPVRQMEVLVRPEGTFQGRINELTFLGTQLTGDERPFLITIQGEGGQGKTALAREAVERFAYAWSGGVLAISLEHVPSREHVIELLADFLGIPLGQEGDPERLERNVLTLLSRKRTLLVLDNAETYIEAVEAKNDAALHLTQFLREALPRPAVSLLVTSRLFLGWAGEVRYQLGGLAPDEGVNVFLQYVAQRIQEIDLALVEQLSRNVDGHPLSLRLLGSAFSSSTLDLASFVHLYEEQLVQAEDTYKDVDHRQRTLYASIKTSIELLPDALRQFLSNLRIFQAAFLLQTALAIFGQPAGDATQRETITHHLQELWWRGLLHRTTIPTPEGDGLFYRLPPVIRLYIERNLPSPAEFDQVRERFGLEYGRLILSMYDHQTSSVQASILARQAYEDIEHCIQIVPEEMRGYCQLYWGEILQNLGEANHGLALAQQAFEIAQAIQNQDMETKALQGIARAYQRRGQFQRTLQPYAQALTHARAHHQQEREAEILADVARVYRVLGQPAQALRCYEQALTIFRQIGRKTEEGTLLHNMGIVHLFTGQLQQALALEKQALSAVRESGDRGKEALILTTMGEMYYQLGQVDQTLALNEEALPLLRALGNKAGEAVALNNIAGVYRDQGQPQRALDLYEQALVILRQIDDKASAAITQDNLSRMYEVLGQEEYALKLREQALVLAREAGDKASETVILNNLASTYDAQGRSEEALHLCEQAAAIARGMNNPAGEAMSLNKAAAILYSSLHQPEEAMATLEQSLRIFQESCIQRDSSNITEEMVRNRLQLVRQEVQGYEPEEQALLALRQQGDRAGEIQTLEQLAREHAKAGNLVRARTFLEQALPLIQQTNELSHEASIHNEIAVMYARMEQVQPAITHWEQALVLLNQLGDQVWQRLVLLNMAQLYLSDGQRQRALALYEKSLALVRAVADSGAEAELLNRMAMLHDQLAQPEQALTLLEQALVIARQQGNRTFEMMILTNSAGILYYRLQRQQEAVERVEQALELLRTEPLLEEEDQEVKQGLQTMLATMRAGVAVSPEQKASPQAEQQANLRQSPFDTDVIAQSVAALVSSPQEKLKQMQSLAALAAQTTDPEFQTLMTTIQLAFLEPDLSQLGGDLHGVYREAWEQIVRLVEALRKQA